MAILQGFQISVKELVEYVNEKLQGRKKKPRVKNPNVFNGRLVSHLIFALEHDGFHVSGHSCDVVSMLGALLTRLNNVDQKTALISQRTIANLEHLHDLLVRDRSELIPFSSSELKLQLVCQISDLLLTYGKAQKVEVP
jgi:hypothetical protein